MSNRQTRARKLSKKFQNTDHLSVMLNQEGGSIFYNPFIHENKLVRMKYNQDNKKITYENLTGRSNIFTDDQKRDIDAFINFVLPFLVNPPGNEIVGPDIIEGLQVIGAGSFGVTLSYKELLIKILKIEQSTLNAVANELNISGVLFYDNMGNRYQNVPPTINHIYGYLTSNQNILNQLHHLPQLSQDYVDLRLFTNMPIFDVPELKRATKDLTVNVQWPMQGHIAILFLKKADMSLTNYIKIFQTLAFEEKVSVLKKFLLDMKSALRYIHLDRGYIHNDIKPDNIVVDTGLSTIPIQFQLIDFGLLTKINRIDDNQSRNGIGTKDYMMGLYKNKTNIFYDWHCVLISLLQLLDININIPFYSQQKAKNISAELATFFNNLSGGLIMDQNTIIELNQVRDTMVHMYQMYFVSEDMENPSQTRRYDIMQKIIDVYS